MNAGAIIILVLIFVILLILAFRLSMYLMRRAICTVIRTFQKHEATSIEKAKTLKAMGLSLNVPLISFRFFRDYRPWALQTLIKAGVVRTAIDDWFYLSEEALKQNKNFGCKP